MRQDRLNVPGDQCQAISDLVEVGILERVHGKGTFVTGPQVDSQLHLTSFSREMRASGSSRAPWCCPRPRSTPTT